jgi:hypothetical protein
MSEKDVTVDDVEETTDDISEPEEPVEDETGEDEESPEESEPTETSDDEAEEEYVDSVEEYLAQFHEDGLPREITDVDALVQYALKHGQTPASGETGEKLRQIEEKLSQLGVNGIDALMSMQPQPQPQTQTPAPSYNSYQDQLPTYSTELDAAVQDGLVDPDAAAYFKPYAKVQDAILKRLYNVLFSFGNQISEFSNTKNEISTFKREAQWNNFDWRERFGRKELDAYRDKHNFPDYQSAALSLMAADPTKFAKFQKDLQDKSEIKAHKKLRDIKQLRKKGGGQKIGGVPNWRTYRIGPGAVNEEKLDADLRAGKITDKQYQAICDAVIADFEKHGG